MFAVALCWLVFAPDMRPALAVAAAVVGVLGALTHILLLVPSWFMAPVRLRPRAALAVPRRRTRSPVWRFYSRRWRRCTGSVEPPASLSSEYVGGAGEGSLGLSSIVRSPVGLGPNFVAMNVAFAYEPFVDRLTALAPTMEVDEERVAAERSPLASRIVAPITLVSVVVLGLVLLALAARHWRDLPGWSASSPSAFGLSRSPPWSPRAARSRLKLGFHC